MDILTLLHWKLNMHLTKIQSQFLAGIEWLIDDDAISQGRSTVLAIAFILKAINHPQQRIRVFDHWFGDCHYSAKRMMEIIKGLISRDKILEKDFEFYYANYQILYTGYEESKIRAMAGYRDNKEKTAIKKLEKIKSIIEEKG